MAFPALGVFMVETGLASMRFIRGTNALLGCPEDCCRFDFIFTPSTIWALEMNETYDIALCEKLVVEFEVIGPVDERPNSR